MRSPGPRPWSAPRPTKACRSRSSRPGRTPALRSPTRLHPSSSVSRGAPAGASGTAAPRSMRRCSTFCPGRSRWRRQSGRKDGVTNARNTAGIISATSARGVSEVGRGRGPPRERPRHRRRRLSGLAPRRAPPVRGNDPFVARRPRRPDGRKRGRAPVRGSERTWSFTSPPKSVVSARTWPTQAASGLKT